MKRRILAVVVLVAAGLFGCGKGHDAPTKEPARVQISGLTVEKISARDVERYYETSGSVRAETLSVISSKVMGEITSIRVQAGDRVRKGQLLMTIDDADLSKKVKAAEAAYEEARSALTMARENRELVSVTHERFKKLYEEKALTRQEMDEIETKKRIAESQLNQAEAMVGRSEAGLQEAQTYRSYTRITSPIDGIVSERKIDLGTMAAPGMPLIIVEDPSVYSININIDERLFPRITKGMNVRVEVSSLGIDTTGTVSEIGQAIDPASRTFLAKIMIKGKGLRSGLYATVGIPDGRATLVMVPAGAVVRRGQLTGVYVVDGESVVTFRLVKTGGVRNGMVEVLSGMDGSELVVTGGADRAVDGGMLIR